MAESDLRALAAEAMRGKTVQTFQDAADAVLAAVLPVHRRQVLAEAVDAIELAEGRRCPECRGKPASLKWNRSYEREGRCGCGHRWTLRRGDWLDPVDVVRRLAETAPPAPRVPTESLQDASAVPVATPNPSTGVSGGRTEPADESPWLAGGPTAQAPGRHIYRTGDDSPIGSMDTPDLAEQVVAEHRHAVQFRALTTPEEPGPTQRPDDAGTLAVRLAQLRDEALTGLATGDFIAVSRREWAALLRERAQFEHTIDGLADAALRLSGVRELATERARFALEVTAERDRLREAVERARARIEESRRVVPGNGAVE